MQTQEQDLAAFMGIAILFALLTNIALRRLHHGWWIACISASVLTALANLFHEAVLHDFAVRPTDLTLWIPLEFMFLLAVAIPFTLGISTLFLVVRQREASHSKLSIST